MYDDEAPPEERPTTGLFTLGSVPLEAVRYPYTTSRQMRNTVGMTMLAAGDWIVRFGNFEVVFPHEEFCKTFNPDDGESERLMRARAVERFEFEEGDGD